MRAFPNSSWQDGMELRDYFAIRIYCSMLSNPENKFIDSEKLCVLSYIHADQMIKQREYK